VFKMLIEYERERRTDRNRHFKEIT
jgi:hypothetical protein